VRRLARLGQKAKAEEKEGKSSNSTNISGKTDLAKCVSLWTRLFQAKDWEYCRSEWEK
jgi:hypothetical protein